MTRSSVSRPTSDASHGSPSSYAATAATTPSGDHESLRAIGSRRSADRATGSGATTCAQRRPAVLNAFEAATTATAWSAVPSSDR